MSQLPSSAELEVADTIGRLMQFWGFKRPMGRIWSLLYLAPKPLGAAEIGSQLTMSSGAVSMALADLERWGAVHRTWVPGERREYFTAEPSVWKMVQRVLRERELALIREFRDTLDRAVDLSAPRSETPRLVEKSSHSLPADAEIPLSDEVLSYKRARLLHLRELTRTGETLLAALAEGAAVDPTLLFKTPEI